MSPGPPDPRPPLEPLKDVELPAGVQGWRILYTTTVDDNTPATAVAIVFAPTHSSVRPRPVIAWEHGTTGQLTVAHELTHLIGCVADGGAVDDDDDDDEEVYPVASVIQVTPEAS